MELGTSGISSKKKKPRVCQTNLGFGPADAPGAGNQDMEAYFKTRLMLLTLSDHPNHVALAFLQPSLGPWCGEVVRILRCPPHEHLGASFRFKRVLV